MDEVSKRREFLRHASLAGVALVAGVAGCCDKTKAELERVKAENAELQNAAHAAETPQVDIDPKGNILILDENLKYRLWAIWQSQKMTGKPNPQPSDPDPPDPDTPPHPRKGFHVRFTINIPSSTGTPEEHKVNSLCSC
jgi:hypothetical protein